MNWSEDEKNVPFDLAGGSDILLASTGTKLFAILDVSDSVNHKDSREADGERAKWYWTFDQTVPGAIVIANILVGVKCKETDHEKSDDDVKIGVTRNLDAALAAQEDA